MDLLNDVFCFVMAGFLLPVGAECSGAKTFLLCQALAALFCMSERWSWRMHAYAALVAIAANVIRIALTLLWILKSWPYFPEAHDIIGWICVASAAIAVALYNPTRPRYTP